MRLVRLMLTLLVALAPCQGWAEESAPKAFGAPRFEVVAPDQLAAAGFDPAQSRGVFIGINDFDDESVIDLKFASDDAIDLAHRFAELGLIRPEGIALGIAGPPAKEESIARLASLRERGMPEPFRPVRTEILKRIGQASRQAGAKGLLVLTMSTHGFHERGDALFAADTTADLDLESGILAATSVSYDSVVQLMLRSPAPRRLALVDACRERLQRTGTKAIGRDPALPAALSERLAQTKGIAMVLAAPPGGYGYDGGEDDRRQPIRNGVFTHFLLRGLDGEAPGDEASGFVTLGGLLDYTQSRLAGWTTANGRPLADGGAGISFREFDRALMGLPLAVDPGRVERLKQLDARRQRCRELLGQAFAAEPAIVTAAILGEVSEALNKWDNEQVEPLLTAIEKLAASTPESRRYFVKVDWDALRIPTPTPTPAVTTAPRPTPAATVAGPRTRIVAADGTEAYGSISKAIADSARGDTVMIRPGVYRELVQLRSGVRVSGSGPESTRIEPTEGHRFAVVAIDCEDAVLEQVALNGRQLTMANAFAIGLTFVERDGALFTDVVVPDGPAALAGVPAGARVVQFNGRTVEGDDYWALHQEANAVAKVVLELELDGARQTIDVVPQMIGTMGDDQNVTGLLALRSSVTLDQVIIRDFTYHGISISGPGASNLRDIRVLRTGGSGLQVIKGATAAITGGTFADNAHCGILASGITTSVTFEKGSISASGMTGALARLHARLEVREATIDNSKGSGARTYDGAELVLHSVQIKRSAGEGATAEAAWLELHDCTIDESGSNGVLVWKPGAVLKASGVTSRNSTKHGIFSAEGARCFVEKGVVELNEAGGIRIAASPDFKIDGPTVKDNQFDGLAISDGSSGHVENVSADKNAGDGIAIWGAGTNVTNRVCSTKSNGRYGYFISTSATVALDTTFADNNKDAGYAISQGAVVTAADCNAADNAQEGFTVWTQGRLKAARCLVSGGETGFIGMSEALLELDRCESSKASKRAFAVYGAGTKLDAVGCRARESNDGFLVGNAAAATIRDSESTGHVDTGIYAFGEGSTLTATGNKVATTRIGIWLQGGAHGTVTGNTVDGTTGNSLGMSGEGTEADMRDNTLVNNADGNNMSVGGGARNTAP